MAVRKTRRKSSSPKRSSSLHEIEKDLHAQGFLRIAGIDEAGRGPLAGPVCAAAVIFPPGTRIRGVNDSKQLEPEMREKLHDAIMAKAIGVGIGWASADEIDAINILRATHLAARRALQALTILPDHLILDALTLDGHSLPQMPLVKGDARCFSIAAASIIAKVSRDRLMVRYDEEFPGYGFAKHKGYGTAAHRSAIERHGPTTLHRRSFLGDWFDQYDPKHSATHSKLCAQLTGCATQLQVEELIQGLKSHSGFLPRFELESLTRHASECLSFMEQR